MCSENQSQDSEYCRLKLLRNVFLLIIRNILRIQGWLMYKTDSAPTIKFTMFYVVNFSTNLLIFCSYFLEKSPTIVKLTILSRIINRHTENSFCIQAETFSEYITRVLADLCVIHTLSSYQSQVHYFPYVKRTSHKWEIGSFRFVSNQMKVFFWQWEWG